MEIDIKRDSLLQLHRLAVTIAKSRCGSLPWIMNRLDVFMAIGRAPQVAGWSRESGGDEARVMLAEKLLSIFERMRLALEQPAHQDPDSGFAIAPSGRATGRRMRFRGPTLDPIMNGERHYNGATIGGGGAE